jgi:GH24 family phage-related lysozyme (muramidase)
VRPSVLAAFPAFTDSLEGWTIWPYLDVKGLATVGRGDLVDPFAVFARGPWEIDGVPATPDEIAAGWSALKGAPSARLATYYSAVTKLRLTKEAIDALSFGRLAEMESTLRARFPNWDSIPADAQLAIVSISWACGPAFRFPKLEIAISLEDYARTATTMVGGAPVIDLVPGCCAAECGISTAGNPGIAPRNARDRALFVAAQHVVDSGGDLDLITGWVPAGEEA